MKKRNTSRKKINVMMRIKTKKRIRRMKVKKVRTIIQKEERSDQDPDQDKIWGSNHDGKKKKRRRKKQYKDNEIDMVM